MNCNLALDPSIHQIMHYRVFLKLFVKLLDSGNLACGIFGDLQKAFDTVDHQILLKKLEHYGIIGRANDWFNSYLSNRQQFVSINGYNQNPKS